jgi:hypothetical membrane protein
MYVLTTVRGPVLPSSKRIMGMRVAGLCGTITPVVVFSLIALALFCSPWFSWTENALSDLGVQGIAAILFNSGLIIGGLLTTIFAIGLREILPNRTLGRAGTLLLILDAATLCAIGVFPETTGTLHFYVSVAFFTLLPMSLFLIGAAMIREPRVRKLGMYTVLTGVVAAVVWALPWRGAAIPETLASLVASVWSMVFGIRLFRQA